ncbi:endonuclease domain-containing protein [Cryptosporangium japonicum]|uniref:DUF559 domain-containing protein n=1 Tax=Cryptosporangium japonicum TaxID=80872 RepID=A0ABN0V9F0_9ACTN
MHLVEVDAETLALALDPLPRDAPVVLTYHPRATASQPAIVAEVLGLLEASAIALFPAWLPEAAGITEPSDTNVAAVRALASRLAGRSRHFGPFLADLAARALTGAGSDRSFQPEVRAAGLTRVLLAAYSRADVVLVVDVPEGLPAAHETPLIAALEWLAFRGGLGGVWLTGAPLADPDRVQSQRVRLPTAVPADTRGGPAPETLTIPSLGGRPNPNSAAEQLLEKVLSSRAWARGRTWNQPFSFGPLTSQIRIDLCWEAERTAVEVDGPEHRGPLHYATDRTRDVLLQTAGYAVLRFTNDQVLGDVNAVAHQLELFLEKRRGE